MTLRQIVEAWLSEHGYDGLVGAEDSEPCGCAIGDLMPCEEPPIGCRAAYRAKDDEGNEYSVRPAGGEAGKMEVPS